MTTPAALAALLTGAALASACTPKADAPDGSGVIEERLVDCVAAEQGIEFFPFPVADFDAPNAPGVAQFLYGYVDGTSTMFAEGDVPGKAVGYQPPAVSARRCSGDPTNRSNHVLHVTGGPFLGWGGGLGVALEHLSQETLTPAGAGLCRRAPLADYCPPSAIDPGAGFVPLAQLDLSRWDGVAVWARRGSNSQPLLRVLVGNKDTDDDISYLAFSEDSTRPRNCERIRECACTYRNLACTHYDEGMAMVVAGGGYYCGAPGAAPGPAIMAPTSNSTLLATNTCNVTRCNDPYAAYPNGPPNVNDTNQPDPQFRNRPCTAHAFRSGLQSSYCFDPAVDQPPAEPDQQCGDHFTAPLHLTTEWQLFLVPFSSMFQQGFGKRAPTFDLKSVSVVRLTWEAGTIDYWIDDLRFYRVKR